jgi:acetyl-CoA carboxylase biotin carboxyl carrier protein
MSDVSASAKANESERSGRSSSGSEGSCEPSLNLDELRELADLVNEYGFTDFKFENEKIKVRLSKQVAAHFVQAAPQVAHATAANPVASASDTESTESAADPDEGLHKILSPIVGTFYRAPGPDMEPYVKEGSKVTPDSVVCIVEAMKLMNEIQAETGGEVVKIYVENGQPVEYGQPLFGIRN